MFSGLRKVDGEFGEPIVFFFWIDEGLVEIPDLAVSLFLNSAVALVASFGVQPDALAILKVGFELPFELGLVWVWRIARFGILCG